MNDLTMTVNGWVATEPKQNVGPTGVRLTSFRVASTARYFDREKNEWVDGRTEWFNVRVFRNPAITVGASIKKGQPVIVHGRFRTNEWESDTGTRVDLVIEATSVGHDLTRGTAKFTRAVGDESLIDPRDGSGQAADAGVTDAGSGEADNAGEDAATVVGDEHAEREEMSVSA
ncbi:MAG: single-stranded DNA-binding protein [Actinobacteria bacterium HGW-Actinobacteria-4]|nr:MAG: single-stranded DNA-binding protein [Actinobacteria bacterium HGW-Actinobacteria-4]